jgi:hypothetical protein
MANETKSRPNEAALKRNIYERYLALLGALRNPRVAPAPIIDGCKTQAALADMDYPQRKITRMSRMSLFKYADLVLAGPDYQIPDGEKNAEQSGWAYLDWLRKQVFTAGIQSTTHRTKAARAARYKKRKEVNTDKLQQAERHALAVSKAYIQLFRDIRAFANSSQLNDVSRQRIFNILNSADGLHSELFSSNDLREDNVKALPSEKT